MRDEASWRTAGVGVVVTSLIVLAVPPAWSGESAPQQIVPGVGIGPARLGMRESEAHRVLARAGLEKSWCSVDILARGGRVLALGTRFGGCLVLPGLAGIFQNPARLVRAFGPATRFTLVAPVNVLLWPNGLVARTAIAEDGEFITYLAVIAPRTTVPPYALLSAAP